MPNCAASGRDRIGKIRRNDQKQGKRVGRVETEIRGAKKKGGRMYQRVRRSVDLLWSVEKSASDVNAIIFFRLSLKEQKRKELYAKQGRGSQFTSKDERDQWIQRELKSLTKQIKDKTEHKDRLQQDLEKDEARRKQLEEEISVSCRIYKISFWIPIIMELVTANCRKKQTNWNVNERLSTSTTNSITSIRKAKTRFKVIESEYRCTNSMHRQTRRFVIYWNLRFTANYGVKKTRCNTRWRRWKRN